MRSGSGEGGGREKEGGGRREGISTWFALSRSVIRISNSAALLRDIHHHIILTRGGGRREEGRGGRRDEGGREGGRPTLLLHPHHTCSLTQTILFEWSPKLHVQVRCCHEEQKNDNTGTAAYRFGEWLLFSPIVSPC